MTPGGSCPYICDMATVAVNVRRVEPKVTSLDQDLERAKKLAVFLDGKFSLFGVRFGMDAVIGLVPGVGDTVSALLGSYFLYLAWKHKLGGLTISVMVFNLLLDWLIGLMPAIGDVADVFFKAHIRNLHVLEKAIARKRAR